MRDTAANGYRSCVDNDDAGLVVTDVVKPVVWSAGGDVAGGCDGRKDVALDSGAVCPRLIIDVVVVVVVATASLHARPSLMWDATTSTASPQRGGRRRERLPKVRCMCSASSVASRNTADRVTRSDSARDMRRRRSRSSASLAPRRSPASRSCVSVLECTSGTVAAPKPRFFPPVPVADARGPPIDIGLSATV